MAKLLESGYERVPMVEGRGQCAMRGSIFDVFPPAESDAVRVEFFDDEIDSIRRFDCISQRSIARVASVRITPAAECLLTDREAAAERYLRAIEDTGLSNAKGSSAAKAAGDTPLEGLLSLEDFLSTLDALENDEPLEGKGQAETEGDGGERNAADGSAPDWQRQRLYGEVDRLRAGHPPRTGSMWMNVLNERTVTVLDYLKDAVILGDRPEQWPARAEARASLFSRDYGDARRRGDAFPAQRELLLSYEAVLPLLASRTCVLLTDLRAGLGQLHPSGAVAFDTSPAMPYQSRLEPLARDVAAWKGQGCAVVLFAGGEARGRRLQRALEEQGVGSVYAEALDGELAAPEVYVLPVSYSKGFVHAEAGLCLLSDTDLYGTAYQRARKSRTAGERIASFTDLKPGDCVVHDFHGVAVYQGIVQMADEGVKSDFLFLRYAGNDKLYVPTDQFDRVQKFIGAERGAPKLNRLGGAEWSRQKGKVKAGLKKLAFDLAELYAKRQQQTGYAFSAETPWQREFEDAFPYELTQDQQQSVQEIEKDMESSRNMDRLLCGDVGYGKTEVALRAAFKAVLDGKQVALLAPTTILVQQHFHTVQNRFSGFPVVCDMLSRFRSASEQRGIMERLKEGRIDLIVGTHRLLGKDVRYKDLGLLIVDEEHRFGVNHKETIKHMKARIDVLTLTATPIPRTLHMSLTGIRDMSVLETPPEERLPVKTYVMEYDDAMMGEAIRREMARGGQVYFLYNRVRSIERMYERLKALVPEARIGIAHGQMRESALEDIMLDFYAGSYDILLCTTIIESGLDVPQANTLIVFDSVRFGLSQLYQMRGRVGRSNRQAYAYFTVIQDRLLTEAAEKRLSAIREFTEFGAGYRIALRDLEIRGAGDVLGPQQHGQLSAVGYDMYVKLMEQAVCEAKGTEEPPELDTRVELRVDAFLPESYVPSELLRIETYKRIAMIGDEDGRMAIEEELIDRFGDIPPPVQNLTRIAELRAVTRLLGVSHLQLRGDGVHLRLAEAHMPDFALLYTAMGADPRLFLAAKRNPEMVIRQANLTPEAALPLSVDILTRVLRGLRELQNKHRKE